MHRESFFVVFGPHFGKLYERGVTDRDGGFKRLKKFNEMKHALRVSLVIAICLHSVSVVAEQAPLALSNGKAACKHVLCLIIRVNKNTAA